MDDYPNSDEEFEAMHADELELLQELNEDFEDPFSPKSRKSLDFAPKVPNSAKTNAINVLQNIVVQQSSPSALNALNNSFTRDFAPLHTSNEDEFVDEISYGEEEKEEVYKSQDECENINKNEVTEMSGVQDSTVSVNDFPADTFNDDNLDLSLKRQKRTIATLFGDIDDILDYDLQLPCPKKYKKEEKNIDKELALIEHILELRRLAREENDPIGNYKRGQGNFVTDRLRDNLSYRVPRYPFIPVTRSDGNKVYVRCHNEEYEKEERDRITSNLSFKGVIGNKFQEIWKQATKLLEEQELVIHEPQELDVQLQEISEESNLWVERYKPKKYWELLSDESTNRKTLSWLKLWDKVVFNRRPKIKMRTNEGKYHQMHVELDADGRPKFKVAMLCGPPGLGKTTLAHMVAKHAGYKVVEINASDDRSTEAFKKALDNATQMSSVLDVEKRPNCLVFDEIDGAPSASIDYLLNYINGGVAVKSKGTTKGKAKILKRPIICICNDAYVPALRALRQMALVIHFPATSSQKLSQRLSDICKKEGIKASSSALLALSEKSNNDIRSCLSYLTFFKGYDKFITVSDVMRASIGQKDIQKGLFSVWQDIFTIERPKEKDQQVTLGARWNKIVSTVTSFGDYERLTQGVFENYPLMKTKDKSFENTCEALEWFCYSDIVNVKVNTLQNYSLGRYLTYAFVVWHYAFGTFHWTKLVYPTVANEIRSKTVKQKGLLEEVIKGLKPIIRAHCGPNVLKLDLLPLLNVILIPDLRQVDVTLYNAKEKQTMQNLVSIMIDYNFTYVQQSINEGGYTFSLDPSIEEIVYFSSSKRKRGLTYLNRQVVAREIVKERCRRSEEAVAAVKENIPADNSKKIVAKEKLPNHLQRLAPQPAFNEKEKRKSGPKNWFVMSKPKDAENQTVQKLSSDIYFKYKEGHTNAVRKTVKVSSWY